MVFRKNMEKYYFRALLLHYWKQNLKATESARKICEIVCDGVLQLVWYKIGSKIQR